MRLLCLLPLLLLLLVTNTLEKQHKRDHSGQRSKTKRSLEGTEHLKPLRRSKRRWILSTIVLEENEPGPYPKLAGDLFNDRAENISIKYLISGPGVDEFPEVGLFSVNELNGQVFVHRPIDREKTPLFVVRFDAIDRETGSVVDKALIFNVEIKDKNDNVPEFVKKEYNISVRESFNLENPLVQVLAVDKDKEDTANSDVSYTVVSHSPSLKDLSFNIDPKNGLLRGKGCLSYEKASLIKVTVRAYDNGIVKLSSTTTVSIHIEDGNNHLPEIIMSDYKVTVKEEEVKNDVLRIKVNDMDTPQTPAWRAKYKIIAGNEKGNYILTTDPVTNEGILSIQKPLDFEGTPFKKVVIAVENEELLFTCLNSKVKVNSSPVLNNVTVSITVLDNNDAPIFSPLNLIVREKEGLKAGTVLGKLNATDPDRVPNKIRFYIANDPADWVTVDENTGVITTKKELDRESPYVNKTLYACVIHAIDDGDPSQTGSTTISLFVSDINDNTPYLLSPYMEACEQLQTPSVPGPRSLSIRASDKDLDPYSGPFQFELADNSPYTKDNWKIGKTNPDDSVDLLMLRKLPKGNYSVPLNIYDRQGTLEKQTLNIRICNCPDGQKCEKLQPAEHNMSGGAIAIIFVALLLFLIAFCFLFSTFCGSIRNKGLVLNEEGNQTLIQYNEEGGGSITKAAPVVLTSNGNLDFGSKDLAGRTPSGAALRAQYDSWQIDGAAVSAAKHHVQNPNWNRDALSSIRSNQNNMWKGDALSSIRSNQNNMWKGSLGAQSQTENSSMKTDLAGRTPSGAALRAQYDSWQIDGAAVSAAKHHVQNPNWNRDALSSIRSNQNNMWKGSMGAKSQTENSSMKTDVAGRTPPGAVLRAQYDFWQIDGAAGSAAKHHVQNPNWNREAFSSIRSTQNNMWKRSMGAQSQAENSSMKTNSKYLQSGCLKNKPMGFFIDSVGEMVNQRLQGLAEPPKNPPYKPRVYAYEGELERIDSLGSFSIAESELDWRFLDDLDPKFAKLEEICRQPL
ncbi:cadherin-like protein 26 isoform X2 [Xenopus laevis]|uniref:Cadherin-like protein 26 n=1 Tax=Xenopus laevis TaxID=8355 RepID=A0A8J0TT75_XENLA|nr:cadherin-like protein 26 isoform X2 [Xenopus laevis]